jgi:hypothetical protein
MTRRCRARTPERPGFKTMMDRIAGNGVRVIIVESPDRFARDLAVQIARHDYLKGLGVALVPTSAPDFYGRPCALPGSGTSRRAIPLVQARCEA